MVEEIDCPKAHTVQVADFSDINVDFVRRVKKSWTFDGIERSSEGLVHFNIWATEHMIGDDWTVRVIAEPISKAFKRQGALKGDDGREIIEKKFETTEEKEAEKEALKYVEELSNMEAVDLFDETDAGRSYISELIRRLKETR